ncbi:MAG: GNAT family N-acetyltransferase [Bacteroidales bacterium]|nr:GNAT family N-acetyltransferase [Bacteroidales bacterium]
MKAEVNKAHIELMCSIPEKEIASAIKEILIEINEEFVPSLSSRESTITKHLINRDSKNCSIDSYLNYVLAQNNLLAFVDAKLVGLMSFRDAHTDLYLGRNCPCSYVSTIGVKSEFRRNGLARCFYKYLMASLPYAMQSPFIATRTWSTNLPHINLLKEMGFDEVSRLKDHRGIGIDTVYYAVHR